MTFFIVSPDFFFRKMLFLEIFLKKKSGVDRKENKMRYKKALLAACATVLPMLQAENVCAMGEKPRQDAAYYVNDLKQAGNTEKAAVSVRFPKKMLVGCAATQNVFGSKAKGIYVLETGEFYGIDDYPQIDRINLHFQQLLTTDAAKAKELFDSADKANLSALRSGGLEAGADYCFVTYSAEGIQKTVKWLKDPLLRDLNPPSQEAVDLFERVQNAVIKK